MDTSHEYSNATIDFAHAIAHAEGFGQADTIPTKAHNPGDIIMPGWTGPTLGSEHISVFADDATGWRVLYHQVELIETGKSHVYELTMTFEEMAEKWTNTQVEDWARNVVAGLVSQGYDVVLTDPIGKVWAVEPAA